MIWFTADTHYNHKNIVRGTAEWEDKQQCRDFDTLEAHNDKLVANFNELVQPQDIVYHLGDWSFGGIDSIKAFRDRLYCKDIRICLGNHDHHIRNNKNNVRSLFTHVFDYGVEITINKQKIVLDHYAKRVWNQSHHGSFCLYGHSHGMLKGYGPYKTMDVGVDTNNLRPYAYDLVKLLLDPKKNLTDIDHHNEGTN